LMIRFALVVLVALSPFAVHAHPAGESLHQIFDEEWELRLGENPLLATSVGVHAYDDRMPDVSAEAVRRSADRRREILDRLGKIDREKLSIQDRINYTIFRDQMRDFVAEWEYGAYQIPLNSDSGFHSSMAFLPTRMPFFTAEDYENYISRLREFPRYFDQHVSNMRLGLERGMTLPSEVLEGIDETIAVHVVDEAEESVFWAPFTRFPSSVTEDERERLRNEGAGAIRDSVVPAYKSFLEFWTTKYVPGARTTLGASKLPDGQEYYGYLVEHFTTLDVTPEEIHEIGLSEVARIRSEMEEIIDRVGFDGTFDEFLAFLRTDPRFYAETPQDLLERAAWIAKQMDGKLPSLFDTLPRLPYTVEPVPDHIAPKYTAGRYVPPSKGSTRPGIYWVNTYDLSSRPLYTLEALTLHEAVPGHHLQGALAMELEELPDFRQYSYLSAFGEGWGLYSEWLGLEAGFYDDPYSNFGRLTYEMWRANRLVVDTGIHAFGWTRQQARDFMAENTALSLHEISTEVDRYISWPGQALAYKMGELEIRRLREKAERELGADFEVREFHDAVLLTGSVPLPVLADQIDRYIAGVRDQGE
ncbi:MAG: DUF885 domain-containing protein, partial [Thermoanaerobaculia bacterium]|nr:DUF885 domain-containing protein [Thermoanaerobaculia bacterium]